MAFPSIMRPDPSDPFVFASIHLLLHNKQQHKERLFRSLGLHDNRLFSSSPATRDRRSHRKHRSRKRNPSKARLHYLKPGALAQIRDAARSATRSVPLSSFCANKRALDKCDQANMVLDTGHTHGYDLGGGETGELQLQQAQTTATSPSGVSPSARAFLSTRAFGPFCPQRKKLLAPKTPLPLPLMAPISSAVTLPVTTDVDSLPLELLVKIVCNLRHDQLKPAFHVSRRFRQAVLIARQCYFDFTTPDRERQDALRPPTHGEIVKMAVTGALAAGSLRPTTPMAPRQVQKPLQARVPLQDMQPLAGPLFCRHENRLHRVRPRSFSRPANRVIASHRVLFYEEQLCQAVAQNGI